MSIVIEQTPKQVRNAFAVHSRADLNVIALVESKIKRAAKLPDRLDMPEFNVDFHPGNATLEEDGLTTFADFRCKLERVEGLEKQEIVSIFCRFEARYVLEEGFEPVKDQIDAFRKGNAIFNVWPYFREYVTSSFLRMGLPPPPVTFLRLARKLPKASAPAETLPASATKG